MAHSSAIFRQCFCGDADSRGRGTLSSGLPNQIKCKGYCICAGREWGEFKLRWVLLKVANTQKEKKFQSGKYKTGSVSEYLSIDY